MFPLSTVLFPGGLLPLHVFEPRYQALVGECQAGDGRFGVVLIERGSEVGGGDDRVPVGTLARIESARSLDEGRWALLVRGETRIRVTEWHPDRPYPEATVEEWPDDGPTPEDELTGRAEGELRRVRVLLSELGAASALPPDLSLGEEPDVVAWSLCALAPVSMWDRQRLLESPGAVDRLSLLVELLGEVACDATRLLAGG
jgi:Lon protease-like protein